MLPDAKKDLPTSSSTWDLRAPKIGGVVLREVKNIPTKTGHTVEVYREDWDIHDLTMCHVISVTICGKEISAWHGHQRQTDHIMVVMGAMQAALFDAREGSPTHGSIDVYNLSAMRPALLVIPPGVFHGFKNYSSDPVMFNNLFDMQYNYEDPDEWRLPPDTDVIPYRFT